jgi:hypothetical protein
MAMPRRIKIQHGEVFSNGAYVKKSENGPVEPVLDFDAPKLPDGSRPQQLDRETGLPVWQVTVLDADEEAGRKDTAVSVKFVAKHRPVPPENKTPFPLTPVEFTGLTALPYIDDNGSKPRLAWSYRAEDMIEPTTGPHASNGSNASSGSGASSRSAGSSGSGESGSGKGAA